MSALAATLMVVLTGILLSPVPVESQVGDMQLTERLNRPAERPATSRSLVDVEAPVPSDFTPVPRSQGASLQELAADADVVGYGSLARLPAEFVETGVEPLSLPFRIVHLLKGADGLEEVLVSLRPGGTAEAGVDLPRLLPSHDYLLFLRQAGGHYEVIGGADANVAIDYRLQTPTGEPFDTVVERIAQALGGTYTPVRDEETAETAPVTAPVAGAPDPKPPFEGTPGAPEGATTTLLYEGFEGAFPGSWSIFDADGSTNGEVYWDDTSYRSYLGSWSAWCADGGANASPPGGDYSNNMDTWMVYGPMNLSDAVDGTFSFRFWSEAETDFDYFKYLVSTNGSQFYGYQNTGATGGWQSRSVDLTNVPTLGDVTGDSSVWIAFLFQSDSIITQEGTYVDEVRVEKTTAAAADLDLQLIDAPSGTFAPGDPITIGNVIQNVGGSTSAGYRITFYASTNTTITSSDYAIGFVDRSGLAPGGTHSFNTSGNLPGSLPDDQYYIGAILTISDANSGNNSNYDSTPITVDSSTPADLDLQLIDAPSGTFAPGDPITIGNVVQNVGGSTSAGYRITFYASTNTTITTVDYAIGFVDRSGLAPGGTHSFNTSGNLPGSLPDDQYYIGAILTISDANSGNNSNYDPLPITVDSSTPADLNLQLIDAPSGTFAAGDPITIGNVIQNIGGSTSAGYRITFYASTNTTITTADSSIGFVDRSGLAPGATHNFNTSGNLPGSLADDQYYIGAILTIADANSSNNSNYDPTPITVSSSTNEPDISVSPLTLHFTAPGTFSQVVGGPDSPPARADDGKIWNLYEVRPEVPELDGEAVVVDSRRIDLDPALLAEGVSSLWVEGLYGLGFEARITGHEVRGAGDVTWYGRLEGSGGRVVLTLRSGRVAGSITTPDGMLQILPLADGGHALSQIDQDLYPPCAGAEWAPGHTAPISSPAEGTDPPDMIDVMSVYTPQARDAAGGVANIEATIQNAVDVTNAAFADSDMVARFRLVHTALANHNDSGNSSTDLTWVRTDPTVAALRNTHGADMVSLITEDGGGSCGRGYVMRNPGAGFESFAFQVTDRGCAVGNLTWAHEHGHNMGFEHDPANGDPPADASYQWSFGHFVDGSYRTVMSYDNQCGSGCTRVGQFSNPDVDFLGAPTGIADQRDNHRTGNLTASIAANFRESVGASESFTISNTGSATLTVTALGLDSPGSWISWSPAASFNIAPGGSQQVTVSVDFGQAPPGQSTRRLQVFSNDLDENPYPGGVDIVVTTTGGGDPVIFLDGFESGSTSAWSTTVP